MRLLRKDGFGVMLILALCCTARLDAAGITGQISDSAGQPVQDAVLSLTPLYPVSSDPAGVAPASAPRQAVMDQWGKQFIPYVLAVQVGTYVQFPNRDNIRHHVYSFSPAKRFELKLYAAGASQPVLFDTPGVVALGCNIHDWMQAYIYVLETPYFATSDAQGHARVESLPAGAYRAEVWHPHLRGAAADFAQTATLTDAKPGELRFTLPLKRVPRRVPPRYYEGRY